MVVVFPAPLGPRRPRISCELTWKVRSLTAGVVPYCLQTWETERIGAGSGIVFQFRTMADGGRIPGLRIETRGSHFVLGSESLGAEVHDVDVSTEADVVGEVPAWIVRIIVEDYVVGVP